MNHFLNFFTLFSSLNGPPPFPGHRVPGLRPIHPMPITPALSAGVSFNEIENILDRRKGRLTIPHSIQSHISEHQLGLSFLPPNPQPPSSAPGVPLTNIINILNRMRAGNNHPRVHPESNTHQDHRHPHHSSESSNFPMDVHLHQSFEPPHIPSEHTQSHQNSESHNILPEHAHLHLSSESLDILSEKFQSHRSSESLNISTEKNRTRLNSASSSILSKQSNSSSNQELSNFHPKNNHSHLKSETLNTRGEHDHPHRKSKPVNLETTDRQTKPIRKNEGKGINDHGSKALIERFKDPIGFHELLEDLDVHLSQVPKPNGDDHADITNTTRTLNTSEELETADTAESDDFPTLLNASVECNKPCPEPLDCSFGLLQETCPRCECAPDPCVDNPCSSAEECIRISNDECVDQNSTICPQLYICQDLGCDCPATWDPVCGTNEELSVTTYINNCTLNCHEGVEKVYDGECWPLIIPRFYFNQTDADDGDEENKTSIADTVDTDDIIFEIVNETDISRRPTLSPSLNMYDNNDTTTTTTTTATTTITAITTATATTTTTTTTTITAITTATAAAAASTTISTTTAAMPTGITTKKTTMLPSTAVPNIKFNTTKENTMETTTQNDILFAKQIIQDFESMLNLSALNSLEKGYGKNRSTESVKHISPVGKIKEITEFKNRLVFLQNDIPRIPKEFLHAVHNTRFTRKPKKASKTGSHVKQNSDKLRLGQMTTKPSNKIEKVNTLNPADDLMFESDDDFTGQDLPKLFDILNGYHFNN